MEEQFASGGVRGVLHRPEQPGGDALILTHGAGSDSNSPLLTRLAPAKPQQKRTDFFPKLRTPALFVHGTKDGFGSVEELREAMALIPARTDLLAVEGAGHDLKRAVDMTPDILARLYALV
jgi:predicted alpha/beta-hydrolase family hydrolase